MLIRFRLSGARAACLLLALIFFPRVIISQETSYSLVPVPEALRRPERGEAPRYPEDLVIGELGQGRAPQAAYLLAQEIVSALARGRNDAAVVQSSSSRIGGSVIEELASINTRSYRIGGGRTEPDGSVSFIVRFIGRTESITGELFLRFERTRVPVTTVVARLEDEGEDEDGDEDEERAEETITVMEEREMWILDDLFLEEKIPLSDIRDDYRYDFSPYERFF